MNKLFIWKSILLPGIILLIIDMVYLNTISKIFHKQIFAVQHSPMTMNLYGAILAYILLILGISYFIIIPKKSPIEAMILGLVIYGVYEGTNYGILKNWKMSTVIIDTLWGSVLFGLTTYLTYILQ